MDAATGQCFIEDLDTAVNKTTKLVDKSYEIYLSLYQAAPATQTRTISTNGSRPISPT